MNVTSKIIIFRDITKCSLVGVDRRFRGAHCLHHQGNYPITTMMMEAVRTSETLVYSETTQRYIPEGSNLAAVKT
jgi:hypothetical protein